MVEVGRQAQGLYAGVALLNELEPYQSLDDADSLLSDTADCQSEPSAQEAQLEEDVAWYRLYGESFWDHPFIQEHLSHSHGEPPRDSNLRSFIDNLRYTERGNIRCGQCKDGLITPPSSDHTLHYNVRGMHDEICRHFLHHHLIKTDSKLIQSSPKLLRLICYVMSQEFYRQKVNSLLKKCVEKRKAFSTGRSWRRTLIEGPIEIQTNVSLSIAKYIAQLSVNMNGTISCGQARCASAQSFDLDIASLKAHFWRHHCESWLVYTSKEEFLSAFTMALEEKENVNRLVELMSVARMQESLWNRYIPSQKVEIERKMLFNQKPRRYRHENLKKMRQWVALRRVRAAFARWHERLLSLVLESEYQYFEPLKRLNSCAGNLLELAALTFKDVSANLLPKSLQEVVSFIMLSYSLAETMKDSGNETLFKPGNGDFRAWRSCLNRRDDRRAFDYIASNLWSQDLSDGSKSLSKQHEQRSVDGLFGAGLAAVEIMSQSRSYWSPDPHFRKDSDHLYSEMGLREPMDLQKSPAASFRDCLSQLSFTDHDPARSRNPVLAAPMVETVTGLLNDASNNDIDFSAFLDIQRLVNDLEPPTIPNHTQVETDELKASQREEDKFSGAKAKNYYTSEPLSIDNPQPCIDNFHLLSHDTSSILAVIETTIYLKAVECLAYLFQIGYLLLCFIGGELLVDGDFSKQSSSQKLRSAASVQNIKYGIIHPLRLDTRFQELQPLLVVTTKLLELGWIICVRDLENYLLSIVKLLEISYELFQQFTHDLLTRCSEAARIIDVQHAYRDPQTRTEIYHDQYIENRVASETADFLRESSFVEDNPAQTFVSPSTVFHTSDPTSSFPDPSTDFTFPTEPPPAQQTNLTTFPTTTTPSPSTFFNPPTPTPPPSSQPPPQPSSPSLPPHTCTLCTKTYTGPDAPSNLRRHTREFHQRKKNLHCPYPGCEMVSARKDNLRRHWVRGHRGCEVPGWLAMRKAERK
ncbi:MAG: hypothetical protein Q9227_002714 [Pyrenula ochraceoflavens]